MALASGIVAQWGIDRRHVDNRYFDISCDFGFKTSARAAVLEEHDTWGYVFRHAAVLLKASDGVVMIHPLDESIPDERAMMERIAAGAIFLSPGVQEPRKNNARTLGLPGQFYDVPHAITRFPIAEVSYCAAAGQAYLPAVQLLIR